MANKVTMQQIADQLGLSKFAVSKALSGKSGVSAETREKIVSVATQLGYFANKQIKASASKRSEEAVSGGLPASGKETVIVLVPNVRNQTRESSYWGRIIDGIAAELQEREVGMVLVTEQFRDSFSNLINPNGVKGIIGVGFVSSQLLLEIRNLGIPFILVDHEDPLIPSDTLFMNNMECVRRVTNYLIGCGHRKLQFVGNIRYARSFADRWSGFRSMLEEHGLEQEQDRSLLGLTGEGRAEMLPDELEGALGRMKEQHTLPTAMVCANDLIAMRVIGILGQLGIAVPEQCSVTGFDNIEEAAHAVPALSTVHVDKEALGRRATEMLLRRVAHISEPQEKVLLSGEFILRDSTVYPLLQTALS
ncbi:LacI family DNA-binding transcriptional regulator [Paenibacillus protaetiae]|uniref:LacI family transcriptional regulator n=1 Tax=Paenibacillus protaetiae TaxID=2509456 RepID=A0A4P6EY44_9BACL|nr:LacI family DNA-binding transcriptional regulator [Paenibacillus protaetiae]QAY67994.1 LacI family transcriptional regulator [Paenibacillus protaetiae]